MTIIITLVAFILLILIMVWVHFLTQVKHNDVDKDIRDRTNKNLYHEHKASIETDFEKKKIDEENYEYLIAELDKSFMQDMEENQTQFIAGSVQPKLSVIWPIVITLFILIFSFFLYQKAGAFDKLTTPKITADRQQNQVESAQKSTLMRIEKLKEQLTESPKNAGLWYSLGQELIGVSAFDAALKSFDKAIEIEGELADLVGAKAQATYYKNKQQITPEVQQLIDKALAINANDASTNILLGMHAFGLTNYEESIKHWQLVISTNQSVNKNALNEAINEAKRRLGLSVTTSESLGSNNEILDEDTDVTTSLGADSGIKVGINVSVSISTEIRNKLIEGSDKVVFVYAIPSSGPRIPVAAVKINASDLPMKITLDDSKAMNPKRKISLFDEVSVFAVISQEGTPGIKPGDFLGQVHAVKVKSNAVIIINTIAE